MATDLTPSSWQVRMMRTAISPRLAIKTLRNINDRRAATEGRPYSCSQARSVVAKHIQCSQPGPVVANQSTSCKTIDERHFILCFLCLNNDRIRGPAWLVTHDNLFSGGVIVGALLLLIAERLGGLILHPR